MGPGLLSLIIFIGVIIIVNAVLKQNIAIAMGVAWLATMLLDIRNFGTMFVTSLWDGIIGDVIFPSMCFGFMAVLMNRTGIIRRLVNILNAIFWRIRGSAGYVSTMTSVLLGMVTGSGPGISAVSGAITIPWMENSGFSKKVATTIVTGNVTLAASTPPSTSMFMLLAMPAIAGTISAGDLYIALLAGGAYVVIARFITVWFYIRKLDIQPVKREDVMPLRQALKEGWKSLFIFLGVLIPLLLTTGPISDLLASTPFGEAGVDSIDMMVWIPVLLSVIIMLEGKAYLPKWTDFKGWLDLIRADIMNYPIIGGTIIFSIAASSVMGDLGIGADMEALFGHLAGMSPIITVMLAGILILIVAGPLNTTGTIAALGSVCFVALTSVGISPGTAISAMLIFAATEGCIPPASAPLFIASGISGLKDPSVCFKDLVLYYGLINFVIGVLIGGGILPMPVF